MESFGVPCPHCGSVRVVVGSPAEAKASAGPGGDAQGHVPKVHRCDCQDCRHAFHHDFAFGR